MFLYYDSTLIRMLLYFMLLSFISLLIPSPSRVQNLLILSIYLSEKFKE